MDHSSVSERSQSTLAGFALLSMAAVWGSTFFMIHDLLTRVPVLSFLAVRFAIASVVLLALAPRAVGRLSREKKQHALVLGSIYGLAQILQTWGLGHTAASVSGFITGLYVVFTPLLAAAILGTRLRAITWLAVVLAIGGLAVLTLSGVSIGFGEAITLGAAALYALHIVGLGAWSTREDVVGMTIIQIIMVTVVCTIAAAPGGITFPHRSDDWIAILYMALAAGALAMFGQTWAQAHLPPTQSAIIMSMEPVFAVSFAVAFGGESFTSRLLIGGGMVVTAMVLADVT